MQCYSDYSLQKHTQLGIQKHIHLVIILRKIFLSYVIWVVTWFLFAPPWFSADSRDTRDTQTGPEYWGFVTLFSIVITIQLQLQL